MLIRKRMFCQTVFSCGSTGFLCGFRSLGVVVWLYVCLWVGAWRGNGNDFSKVIPKPILNNTFIRLIINARRCGSNYLCYRFENESVEIELVSMHLRLAHPFGWLFSYRLSAWECLKNVFKIKITGFTHSVWMRQYTHTHTHIHTQSETHTPTDRDNHTPEKRGKATNTRCPLFNNNKMV